MNFVMITEYYLRKFLSKFLYCFRTDTASIRVDDSINNVSYETFSDYLRTKFQVPKSLIDSEDKIGIMKYLSNKKISFVRTRNEYKVSYPNKIIPQFLLLSCFIISINTCNIGSTSTTLISNCMPINSTHQECTAAFSSSISIDRIMNVACVTLTDQVTNDYIGEMRIGYLSADAVAHYTLEYITSKFTTTQSSNYRCPHARGSYCDTYHCNNSTRDGWHNLDNFYLNYTYGYTTCNFVPNDGGCLLNENACLYSGWGILPDPTSTEGVYKHSSNSPVSVYLYIEINTLNYHYQDFISLSQAGGITLDSITSNIPGTISLYLDQSPEFVLTPNLNRVSYPSGVLSDGINPLGVFSPNLVGDIQTNSPSTIQDFHYYSNIVTTVPSVLQNTEKSNNGVIYYFYKGGLQHQIDIGNRLPTLQDSVDYSLVNSGSNYYSNFRGVRANLTDPGPITLTILSTLAVQRQVTPCSFSFLITDFQGCCSCSQPAYLTVEIVYSSQECLINYFSDDIDLVTVVNSLDNRIYFLTDVCNQDITVRAESVGFQTQSSIHISLNSPVLESFSNGVTTIEQIETSFDNDSSFFDVFDNDWLSESSWWKLFLFIIIIIIIFIIVMIIFAYCGSLLFCKTAEKLL